MEPHQRACPWLRRMAYGYRSLPGVRIGGPRPPDWIPTEPNSALKLGTVLTLTYQNLLFRRVPINSILGFIIRTYKKSGLW